MECRLKDLCLQLFDVGALKFGNFTMKIGVQSPVYFDLRVMISYPKIMGTLSELFREFMKSEGVKFDLVCGVPYTALPLATLISVNDNWPMLIRRKEPKDYGTKKLIEGVLNKGDSCIIIEDVVTTGSSILETVNDLRREGLVVKDSIVVLDREQGGVGNLAKEGVKMRALLTLSKVLNYLREADKIDDITVTKVHDYIQKHQLDHRGEPKIEGISRLEMSLADRVGTCVAPLGTQLLQLMSDKKTVLCVAADVTEASELLRVAAAVGPHTALLKTHSDIVRDWTSDTARQLQHLAKKHNFLILEDRKYADIGNTVKMQYSMVQEWADLVTVHSLPGDGVLDAIEEVICQHPEEPRGVFLVAQLSCSGNLITPKYTNDTIKQAASHPKLVVGLVCQSADVVVTPGLLQLTPGVRVNPGSDSLGQQYNSPHSVVCERGADLAVVGRAIVTAEDPAIAAKEYKKLLWEAYLERVEK